MTSRAIGRALLAAAAVLVFLSGCSESPRDAVNDESVIQRACGGYKLLAEAAVSAYTDANGRPPLDWSDLVGEYVSEETPRWNFEARDDDSLRLAPDPDGLCAAFDD